MNLGIVGFGNFSKGISKYIEKYFDIFVYDLKNVESKYQTVSIDEVLKKDIIMISIPVQFLENFVLENKNKFRKDSIVFDVSSVKIKPVEIFQKYLKDIVFIGTHPLFGPQSIINSLDGHKIVLTPATQYEKYTLFKDFIQNKLNLEVIEMTKEDHDREMAYVQALNHFIVKGLKVLDIKESAVSTPAYKKLLSLYNNLKYDTEELFQTIQKENPYAKEIRERYLSILENINEKLL